MKQKYYIHVIACGLAALVLTACADEFDGKGSSEFGSQMQIEFMAQSSQDWSKTNKTRSRNDQSLHNSVPIQGSDLSLQINVVPGINEYFDEDKNLDGLASKAGKTRGLPLNSGDESSFYQKMGVFTYTYSGSWDGTQMPDFMYNVEEVKGEDGIYASATNYYWPDESQNMRFYAYAPYNSDINTESKTYLSVSSSSTAGVPQLTYEVPADATAQKDLMVADDIIESNSILRQSVWNLNFRHILTAVQFMIGEGIPDGKITKVTIKNVVGKGTFYYHNVENGAETTLDHWELEADKTNFTQTLDFTTSGQQNILFLSGENTFMMIPQELSDDATVEIEMTDSENATTTLTATIGGTGSRSWEQGETVTYNLSKEHDEYILEVTPGDFTVSYGGVNSFNEIYITSYLQKIDDTQEAVSWYAEYYDEDTDSWKSTNELPDYAALRRYSKDSYFGYDGSPGYGGTTAERRRWAMDALEPTKGVSYHAEQLKARAVRGSDGAPFDLSTHAINAATGLYDDVATTMNTANCYVVSQPGTYKFPIVYGNAIKNGVANTEAYAPSGVTAGTYTRKTGYGSDRTVAIITPFVNHLNNGITDPWLKNNTNCMPYDAVLVWQDEDGLINPTSVALDGDYIKFTIPAESIHQGNAMIAVRNAEGTIMWSWHIWVTDENIMDIHTLKNHDGDTYGLMKVNLGWCSNEGMIFSPRSLKIRIRQNAASGKTATFTVTQSGGTIPDDNTRGNCPFYQWGRKDPLLPAEGIAEFGTSPNKTHYSYNGYTPSCTSRVEDREPERTETDLLWTIGESIRLPQYKYQCSKSWMWLQPSAMNLWNANCDVLMVNSFTSEIPAEPDVVKTVYDPCPVGFSLPKLHAFTGMTSDGRSKTNRDNMTNVSKTNEWNGSTTGFYFYCDPTNHDDNNVWYFPCCGYRSVVDGNAILNGLYGAYWTATMSNMQNHVTYISEGASVGVDVTGNGYFCLGFNPAYDSTSAGWPIRPMKEK